MYVPIYHSSKLEPLITFPRSWHRDINDTIVIFVLNNHRDVIINKYIHSNNQFYYYYFCMIDLYSMTFIKKKKKPYQRLSYVHRWGKDKVRVVQYRINVISHVLSRTMGLFGDWKNYTMPFPFSKSDGVFK